MNYLIEALKYVISDNFFWVSMAVTTCMGIFIGSVIYDGILKEVKKAGVVIGSYAILLMMTNAARIMQIVFRNEARTINQPFAGIATIFLVTVFYLLGMYLGVLITNKAHKGEEK